MAAMLPDALRQEILARWEADHPLVPPAQLPAAMRQDPTFLQMRQATHERNALAAEVMRLRGWLTRIHASTTDAPGMLRTMAAVALNGEPAPEEEGTA